MTSKTFVSGTTIDSDWLNDVNDSTYATDSAPAGSFRESLESSTGASLVGYLPTGTGAVATTVQEVERRTINVFDYMSSAQRADVQSGTPTLDHSSAVSAAWTELKARGGGTLLFPNNNSVYQFYLDVSGVNPICFFDFDGAIVRPFSAAATNSTILFADNEGAGWLSTHIRLKNGYFDGRVGGTGSGSINYLVKLNWACIEDEGSTFSYAKIAGIYGAYAQYTKLIDSVIAANAFDANSWGAYFTGPDGAHRSNEVHLVRPKFFSNYNGLYNGGGEAMRITSPTVQDQTGLGIYLHTDVAGNGARSTYISDPWFEINDGYSLKIGTAESTNVVSPRFLTSGASTIQTVTCYDLNVTDAYAIAPVSDIAHPSGNTDTASLTWIGGSFTPTLALTHNGPIKLNIDTPATGLLRKDNMLVSSAQTVNGYAAVGVDDWFGLKAGVVRGVATDLFSLTQLTAAILQYRQVVFTLELYTFDDTNNNGQFGYSGHTQRYAILITNNTTGAPQVYILKENTGFDVGLDTAFQAPGDIAVTASVVSDVITFKANWPGAGAGAAGMTIQSIGYMLRGVGTNSFYLTRL